MSYVRPKKSLGQHFLIDQNIARKIVDSLNHNENILEIGPGKGVLSKYIFERKCNNFKLIEIDKESITYLNENFKLEPEQLIHDNFLDIDIKTIFPEHFAIIGNFPYNIGSQIFFKVLENRNQVDEVICMIQKEVALRIAEKPGSRVYGILSVLLQSFYNIEYLFTVNEKVFSPPPKVKSAVIRLTRNNRENLNCDEKLFFAVVKSAFNQRRKTLSNSLKAIYSEKDLIHPLLSKRAEQLTVEEFVELTKLITLLKENK
jgi:16S rRNA (adenine1518-N6/adenine1519-N6)-dimethyltransferase